jgi:integrase
MPVHRPILPLLCVIRALVISLVPMGVSCEGLTKDSQPCRAKPAKGTRYCPIHTPGRKPKKRRQSRRQFGGIRRLPSGSYQASYWRDGQQHTATFPLKGDADAFLASKQTDMARGEWASPRAGTIPFREFADLWLQSGVERCQNPIRGTTASKYKGLLQRHIYPTFETLPLKSITPTIVNDWYHELHSKHPSTAAASYRLLATILNRAVKDRQVLQSPCAIEGASREPSSERPIIDREKLQAALDATPERFKAAILLATWCQLRRSEILALQRGDIDGGTVSVRRAWVVTETGEAGLGDPKSQAGKRRIHIPPQVMKALEMHLAEHVGPKPTDWLFPGANGDPEPPRILSRVWERARKKAGCPDIRFHDLRHSGLTWVAQTGATQAELMRRGGHSSPAAAVRYQHAADERDKTIAVALENL